MQGLYAAAAAKIAADCPTVVQVETALDAEKAVEVLALSEDVTVLVHPLSDVADPIREAGMIVSQREAHTFGVTMALVYPGGIPQFEPARSEIKSALRGWAPEGASMPVAYAGGQLLDYSLGGDGGRLLWLLRFVVPTQETYGHQS